MSRPDLSRRNFLKASALSAGAASLALADGSIAQPRARRCILLFLVGGPSHLDTFDLKPTAPATVRGPFRPIRSRVSGFEVCEHLPRLATIAHHVALVRSVCHDAAPIHETGHQLMQTGHLFHDGQEYPHYGSVVSRMRPQVRGTPPYVVLPSAIDNTGVSVSHGQGAGPLGSAHEPMVFDTDPLTIRHPSHLDRALAGRSLSATTRQAFDLTSERGAMRDRYGRTTFGQSCLMARRLVESGVPFVTVNMFDSVFNRVTWDCHADGGSLAVTLDDYKTTLCPMFDLAYSALVEDLHQRGMLDSTLVLAMGEFGRTPHLNPRGGRDHWPGCWSILFAGGGIRGGQVVGASDHIGAEPKDRPVSPAEVAATVYQALGINPRELVDGRVVSELF